MLAVFHRLAVDLSADAALAPVLDVIGGHRDSGEGCLEAGCEFVASEAARKFLSDEARRELARFPTLILHDRREERDIVLYAVDIEFIESRAHGRDGGCAVRCMGT